MFAITKSWSFDAAHRLDHLPPSHKCSRPHGHTYTVSLRLESEHLSQGFVVDYGILDDTFGIWLKEVCDHRDLNEVFKEHLITGPTTAENLAAWFYGICTQWAWAHYVTAVTVQETPKTSAIYDLSSR